MWKWSTDNSNRWIKLGWRRRHVQTLLQLAINWLMTCRLFYSDTHQIVCTTLYACYAQRRPVEANEDSACFDQLILDSFSSKTLTPLPLSSIFQQKNKTSRCSKRDVIMLHATLRYTQWYMDENAKVGDTLWKRGIKRDGGLTNSG